MAEKQIQIEKFAGKNLFQDQTLIADNECASATVNVWAPRGYLTKCGGMSESLNISATGNRVNSIFYDINSDSIYFRAQTAGSGGGGPTYPWSTQGNAFSLSNPAPLGYVTGTVSVSGANLVSATGSATLWTSNVSGGDMFRGGGTGWFSIASVEDDTHLTLSTPLPAAIATGTTYTIMPALDFPSGVSAPAWATLNGSWVSSTLLNVPQIYDGTGIIRATGGPKTAFLATHKGYIFGFRTTTASSRLYWSATGNPASWPVNNFVDIDKGHGIGMGLASFGDELVLFKNRKMFKLVGQVFDPANPTYAVVPINTPYDFDFASAWSVQNLNGNLIFQARMGIYLYRQGTTFITRISDKFVSDLPGIFNVTGVVPNVNSLVFDGNYFIWGIQYPGNVGLPELAAGVLDKNNNWWHFRTIGENSGSFSGVSGVAGIFGQNALPGIVLAARAATDRLVGWDMIAQPPGRQTTNKPSVNFIKHSDGSSFAINATWVSKEFNIGFGHFKEISVFFQKQSSGTFNFSWSIDQGALVTTSVDMTVGRGRIIRKVFVVNQRGTTIQLQIDDATASNNFLIFGITITYDTDPQNRLL